MRRLLCFLAFPALLIGAKPTSSTQDVTSLPEFRVFADRELPPPESWDYVRGENFEVLSNVGARRTREFVKDFLLFQNVLGIVAPQGKIEAELPLMIVLCGKGDDFDRFGVKSVVRSERGFATSLVRDEEIATIVVDFGSRSVPVDVPGLPIGWTAEREVHTTQEFFRAYIHLALSQLNPRPPAWFVEGLANIYSSIDYSNSWIEVGLPKAFYSEIALSPRSYWTTGEFSPFFARDSGLHSPFERGDQSILSPFRGSMSETYIHRARLPIQPMAQFFAVGYDSPELVGRGADALNNWQRQATALVHMCLYGEDGRFRLPFLKFVSRATREPVTEELFQACFGMTYKQMAFELAQYSSWTRYTSLRYKLTQGKLLPRAREIQVRRATDAEIGRIKGETFRLAGHEDPARNEFVVAYLRGERDPQLLASLGLMARQRHDAGRAKTYLEAVAASGATVPRPRAYLELARIRHADDPSGPRRSLNPDELFDKLAPLFVAQRLQPQLVEVYLEIAAAWEQSEVLPKRAHLSTLEHGIRVFPGNMELLYRTAALLVKHGYRTDAAPLILRGLRSAKNPELRAKFESLRQSVDRDLPPRVGDQASFLRGENLAPELRQRLAAHRSEKSKILADLRAKLASTAALDPARREQELTAFAASQTPHLRALEISADQLEADLGWSPDEPSNLALDLLESGPQRDATNIDEINRLGAALLRPQGLSPPQIGLLREMIFAAQSSAAARGAPSFFFSPDTARIQMPAGLPPTLAEKIAQYRAEKEALKQEMSPLLGEVSPGVAAAQAGALTALAEQQRPRFEALEQLAETIRRDLARLPRSDAEKLDSAWPSALAARLAAYQSSRSDAQKNIRRDLNDLRGSLPKDAMKIVVSGDPPQLQLQRTVSVSPTVEAQLAPLHAKIEALNRSYAERFTALSRELAELRRAIADHASMSAPQTGAGRSIDELMQEFTNEALRQESNEACRDGYAAVFLPGLSREQRRLLLAQALEKHPGLVFEF